MSVYEESQPPCPGSALQLPQLCWVVTPHNPAASSTKSPSSPVLVLVLLTAVFLFIRCGHMCISFSLLLCGSIMVCGTVGSSAYGIVVLLVTTVSLGLLFVFGGRWCCYCYCWWCCVVVFWWEVVLLLLVLLLLLVAVWLWCSCVCACVYTEGSRFSAVRLAQVFGATRQLLPAWVT